MLVAFLLKGIAIGIVIAVPVGPAGILCLRRTILQGKLAGLASGVGAACADAVFGVVAAFGLTVVSDLLLDFQDWLRAAGGVFLIYVGGRALASTPRVGPPPRDHETLLRDFASTFVVTLTNPITILVFLGIFAGIGFTGENATLARAAALVLGVWAGSLAWWLALTYGAGVFAPTFQQRHLSWINRASAGILLACGAALIGVLLVKHFG